MLAGYVMFCCPLLASAIQFCNCSSLTQKVEKGSEENNVDDTSTNDNEVSN
jgi:hypothetical protein